MPHTPGPWEVETITRVDQNRQVLMILAEEHQPDTNWQDEICEVVMDYSGDTAASNARLIAAAPELLEACRLLMVVATIRETPACQQREILQLARRVLRQADPHTHQPH